MSTTYRVRKGVTGFYVVMEGPNGKERSPDLPGTYEDLMEYVLGSATPGDTIDFNGQPFPVLPAVEDPAPPVPPSISIEPGKRPWQTIFRLLKGQRGWYLEMVQGENVGQSEEGVVRSTPHFWQVVTKKCQAFDKVEVPDGEFVVLTQIGDMQ